MFEFASLLVVFGSYVLPTQPAEYPFKAVVSSGTWEQVRLLTSFLSLRITAGGLLQAIVLNVSQHWDLRIGILRSRCNLDLDEPSSEDVKGNAKPKPKFELNVSVALILAAAVAAMLSACIAVTNQVVVLVLKVRALRTADFPWI